MTQPRSQTVAPPAAESPSVRFDALVEEFIDGLRAGTSPSVTEFAAEHPEFSHEIRRDFPLLLAMEEVAETSSPKQIGDYQIICELGRGGMGIVYLAEHVTLSRKVAVKVLPAHLASDRVAYERFRREATAAAGLHHTNIVPVFEVGESDGVSFYSMQFIPGQNLATVIDEVRRFRGAATTSDDNNAKRPSGDRLVAGTTVATAHQAPSTVVLPGDVGPDTSDREYWRSVAEVGIQAAAALQHAHDNGVIHRDIKPANLLLDASGTVWVSDFGLAKAEFDDASMTQGVVGTLRFMAPERFQSEATAASDVYSLGLTLYELATLQPAFAEPDRIKLIRQIGEQEPTPPQQLNRRIPRDLHTIIVKASAKQPQDRYRSAVALAEDLRRFLELRPIRARSVGPLGRTWRWCKRNAVLSTVLGALVASLIVGLITALILWSQSSQHSRRAEANAERASEAIRDFWVLVSESPDLRRQGNHELRRKLLTKASEYYKQLASEANSSLFALDQAEAHYYLAQVQGELGKQNEWLKHIQASLEICEQALESDRRTVIWSRCHARLGAELQIQNQTDKALSHLTLAIDGYHRLSESAAAETDHIGDLASFYANRAIVHEDLGEVEAAIRDLKESNRVSDRLPNSLDPTISDDLLRSRSETLALLAHFSVMLANVDAIEVQKYCDEATMLARKALERVPTETRNIKQLSRTLAFSGRAHRALGEYEIAKSLLSEAIELLTGLTDKFPDIPEYAHARGRAIRSLAETYISDGQPRPAIDMLLEISTAAGPFRDQPATRSSILRTLAHAYHAAGEFKSEETTIKQALELLESIASQSRNIRDRRLEVLSALWGSQTSQNRLHDALGTASKLLMARRELAEEFPESTEIRLGLAGDLVNYGSALASIDKYDEAVVAAAEGRSILTQLTEQQPELAVARRFLSNAQHIEAWTRDVRAWDTITDPNSHRSVTEALEDVHAACELVGETWVFSLTFAAVHATMQDFDSAIAALDRAALTAPESQHETLQAWRKKFEAGESLGRLDKPAHHGDE